MFSKDLQILESIIKTDELNMPWIELALSGSGSLAISRLMRERHAFEGDVFCGILRLKKEEFVSLIKLTLQNPLSEDIPKLLSKWAEGACEGKTRHVSLI